MEINNMLGFYSLQINSRTFNSCGYGCFGEGGGDYGRGWSLFFIYYMEFGIAFKYSFDNNYILMKT